MGPWVGMIPMAALVAFTTMVAIGAFSWASVRNLPKNSLSSSIVMIATVVVVVATHDLAKGVFVGVLLSALFFSAKFFSAKMGRLLRITSNPSDDGNARVYAVTRQVFFASAEQFNVAFDLKETIEKVSIGVSGAHFWDVTAVPSQFKTPQKIMIAFDASATTKKGMEMVATSPLLRGLECHVVMIGADSDSRHEELAWARTTLETNGFIVSVALLQGDAESVLTNHVETNDIDLLIMGAHGHSRIRQLIVGSTTTTMLRTSSIPVLLLI
jgi:MFS superfamily sulfate permease-like transporter